MRFPAVQTFCKSVKIWQSYREFNGGNFFETQCKSVSTTSRDVRRRETRETGCCIMTSRVLDRIVDIAGHGEMWSAPVGQPTAGAHDADDR